MNRHSLSRLLPILAVGACATLQPPPRFGVDAHRVAQQAIIDSDGNVLRFYGIPIDLTTSRLKNLPYRVKLGQEMAEGNDYIIATITGDGGVEVKVTFDLNGKLGRAETVSAHAIGPKGVGVGSSLAEVKAAWPSGKLLYGNEHGLFVTFNTGSNVRFGFDPKDMPSNAFERPVREIEVPNLTVREIRISAP